MTEAEWDAVIAVHLKGHFAPLRHAAGHWPDMRRPWYGMPQVSSLSPSAGTDTPDCLQRLGVSSVLCKAHATMPIAQADSTSGRARIPSPSPADWATLSLL